ncbi:MAG TPA: methyltransferase domain-containing protein [Dehalococcoidia bacterium]|nr:methyltransferase domain-containing protein [Dehalococcoidia bacterium]
MAERPRDSWVGGDAYESYVGRWSRRVAGVFLAWLAIPPGASWLDVGCGTGALSQAILATAAPRAVHGVDPSESFVAYARQHAQDTTAAFTVGDAQALPVDSDSVDAVVSGLVLNFVPDPARAVAEFARVTRPGGTIAAYVWDYAGQMQLMRVFWDAAVALDPAALAFDEGARFPVCRPAPLAALFRGAGLRDVETRPIDVPTVFKDFDDYWSPFLSGKAPAPAYAISLREDRRAALRERLRGALPTNKDGSIDLIARAWAVRCHA